MKPRCRSYKAYVANIAVTANRPKAVRVSIWRMLHLVSDGLAAELTSAVWMEALCFASRSAPERSALSAQPCEGAHIVPPVTVIAGIEIPSASPVFLTVVGFRVLVGIACVVTGPVAMLSRKSPGRHPGFGTAYYWGLVAVFASASALAAIRWREDYHLFLLGVGSFTAAYIGRSARRQRWQSWAKWHITGMGLSYILLLTAFYVDNGHSLPLWKDLPSITYWLTPGAVGIPLIVLALLRHPLAQGVGSRAESIAK